MKPLILLPASAWASVLRRSRHHLDWVLRCAALAALIGVRVHAAPSLGAWSSIGPKGNFNGATHGRVRSIHIQPFGGGHYIYIGASGGGLWRANGSVGPVWQSLGDNLPNPSVGAFAVHPLVPEDILVGTGDYNRYQGGGMFHTPDGGQTWTPIALPITPGAFFRVYYLPGNLNTLVAATDVGLLRSVNGPNGPWSLVLAGIIADLQLHPNDANIQFCARATFQGGNGGIYKSTDAGLTWNRITTTGVSPSNVGTARIAICRSQPNNMAFMYESGCNVVQVLKTADGGASWSDITGPVAGLGNNQACHAMSIAIRPNDLRQIVVGANNVYSTKDGGQSWTYWDNAVLQHQDITQFYFHFVTGDDVMWFCNDGGIFRYFPDTHTSDSWNGAAAGNLSISTVVDMDARGSVRAAGFQDDGAAASGDSGATWTGYGCCDIYNLAVTDLAPPTFWYNNQPGGPTLKQIIGGGAQDVSDSSFPLINLVAEPFSSRVFGLLTDANGLPSLVSRPFSAASMAVWTRETTSLPAGVAGMTANPLHGQSLFLWNAGTVTVMGKSAGTWSVVRSVPLAPVNWTIGTVVASPSWPGDGWAGTSSSIPFCGGGITLGGQSRILHTRNDWLTTELLGSLPAPAGQVTGLAVNPFDSRQLFVATDRGVYCSQDGGTSWQPFQTGLPTSVYCTRLKYVEALSPFQNDKLVLATCGRGMYERELAQSGIVYVDQRNNSGNENGTREHPFNTLPEGINTTPRQGTMALNGTTVYFTSGFLDKPMTIGAYEAPSVLTH